MKYPETPKADAFLRSLSGTPIAIDQLRAVLDDVRSKLEFAESLGGLDACSELRDVVKEIEESIKYREDTITTAQELFSKVKHGEMLGFVSIDGLSIRDIAKKTFFSEAWCKEKVKIAKVELESML